MKERKWTDQLGQSFTSRTLTTSRFTSKSLSTQPVQGAGTRMDTLSLSLSLVFLASIFI